MATTTGKLADELLLYIFKNLVWDAPEQLRPEWAREMGSVSGVCRRWRRVAKDDVLWRPLHVAILGRHRTLPWVAAVRRAWPTLSKHFTITIQHHAMRLLSPECRALLAPLPQQPLANAVADPISTTTTTTTGVEMDEDEALSWHDAFVLKAGHTRRCLQALRMLERIPQGPCNSIAYQWSESGASEDWCCAVLLCCDRVIDRLLLLCTKHARVHEYRKLFGQETLMLATITGACNVAQMCLSVGEPRHSGKDQATAARIALELGATPMLELVVPVDTYRLWNLEYSWGDLFNIACQRGEVDAASLLFRRTKTAIKDPKEGLARAAKAGHLHVVEALDQLGVGSSPEAVKAAVEECRQDMVALLLSLGCKLSAAAGYDFSVMAKCPRFTFAFLQYLVDGGVKLGRARRGSHYALFAQWPAARANDQVCRYLVAQGADINAVGVGGSPLVRAVRHRDMEHARCLVRCGARHQQTDHDNGGEDRELLAQLMAEVAPTPAAPVGSLVGSSIEQQQQLDLRTQDDDVDAARPNKRAKVDDDADDGEEEVERRLTSRLRRMRSGSGWPRPPPLAANAKLPWHYLRRLATSKCGVRAGTLPAARPELVKVIYQSLPPESQTNDHTSTNSSPQQCAIDDEPEEEGELGPDDDELPM